MKYYLLILFTLPNVLFCDITTEVIHSSASAYYENKTYSNSSQKDDGITYGVGGDIHTNTSAYKFVYEHSHINTKQPPFSKDLKLDKLFLKYLYKLDNSFTVNLNYINILNDNLSQTDDGKIYGTGLSYKVNKQTNINFTQYYSNYTNFNVLQSDFDLKYKFKINNINFKLKSITKYINIDEKTPSLFTKFANDSYITTGAMLHAHYKSYHLGLGGYKGKRVFAVMSDGFKIQHHAFEIDKTYVLSLGKTVSNFVFRTQYIYQRGTELPAQKDNVTIDNLRFVINYKW
jgi:hypothetical protein